MKYKAYCSHNLLGLMNFHGTNCSSHSPSINQARYLPTNSSFPGWRDQRTNRLWERGQEAEQEGREGRPPCYIKTNQEFLPLNCFQNKGKGKGKGKNGGTNIWELKKIKNKNTKITCKFFLERKVTF